MKPLVIYHSPCIDGFGAAFAAWIQFRDNADYQPLNYGATFDKWWTHQFATTDGSNCALDGREIYILDFSFPRDAMDYVLKHCAKVVWLDHHKTAFEMWLADKPDFPVKDFLENDQASFSMYGTKKPHYFLLDNWHSGAWLAWQHFLPYTPVPKIIQHIDDRDRWQFKLEDTKAVNAALFASPFEFELWEHFLVNDSNCEGLAAEGSAILRDTAQKNTAMVKYGARDCTIRAEGEVVDLFRGLSVNCPPHMTSDVGSTLAKQCGTFGLCWHLDNEGMMARCSLRSIGDYDVSAIAKRFGGGGHKNAAGFEVHIAVLLGWL